jgi:hypothetical protein
MVRILLTFRDGTLAFSNHHMCSQNSFKFAAAVLWNDLPDDFRKISNFNQFKNILKSSNGNVCKCSVCADF